MGRAVLEEGIAALLRLGRHVRHARGLAGEHLLARQPVIGQVEGELEHADGLRGLRRDGRGPLQGGLLELGVGDRAVDDAPPLGSFGVVALGQEEDLARTLVARLAASSAEP